MRSLERIGSVFSILLAAAYVVEAADWPQFRGPDRDGKSSETGLMKQWPQGGPAELWSCEGLGVGSSSVAVVNDVVYTCGMIGNQGYLFAVDPQGKVKYKIDYGPEWDKAGNHPGTHTTPTIDGDRLYLMSGHGRVACYKTADGQLIWKVDTLEKFHGQNLRWGIAESVLVDGDKVICTPGGKDATVVALDKRTGHTLWTSKGLSQLSAYCSPVLVERGGKRFILTLVEKSFVGIDAGTGQLCWDIPHSVSYDIQAVSPLYKDGMAFITNGYSHGSHGFLLAADGMSVERKWSERSLAIQHGGAVLVDGRVHGASYGGDWVCLSLLSGKVVFTDRLVGKGSVIYADGMLYGYGENGQVGLIKITPDGYELVSSFRVRKGDGEHWAHPAISNGRLYIRHGDTLVCCDIKAK